MSNYNNLALYIQTTAVINKILGTRINASSNRWLTKWLMFRNMVELDRMIKQTSNGSMACHGMSAVGMIVQSKLFLYRCPQGDYSPGPSFRFKKHLEAFKGIALRFLCNIHRQIASRSSPGQLPLGIICYSQAMQFAPERTYCTSFRIERGNFFPSFISQRRETIPFGFGLGVFTFSKWIGLIVVFIRTQIRKCSLPVSQTQPAIVHPGAQEMITTLGKCRIMGQQT